GVGELGPGRSVHGSPTPFRMSSTLSKPDTTARSAHRRAADQNAVLCAAQQKRFGEPPRRAGKARLHHGHTDEVFMRNGSLLPTVRLRSLLGQALRGSNRFAAFCFARPLSKPTAVTQPCRPEPLFLPHTGPSFDAK